MIMHCHKHLHFPGQQHRFSMIFSGFSKPIVIFKAFEDLENFHDYRISTKPGDKRSSVALLVFRAATPKNSHESMWVEGTN